MAHRTLCITETDWYKKLFSMKGPHRQLFPPATVGEPFSLLGVRVRIIDLREVDGFLINTSDSAITGLAAEIPILPPAVLL